MSTNAIYADYKPAYYANTQQIAAQTSSNSAEEVSVYASNDNDSAKTVDIDYACTDGKDDGKISTGEKFESVGKGVLKSAINLVTAPFTEAAKGNFLPALMVAGGALLCATPIGAPIAVIGGAIGLAKGVSTIVTGLQKADEIANSGTGTDGETKAAYEQVGSGVLTTGLSATAVFGGLKTMKARGGEMAKLGKGAKFGDKVKAFKDDTVTAGKDTFGKLTHKTANAAAASNANGSQQAQGQQTQQTQQTGQGQTQAAGQASNTTSQSGQDISGATKLTKSQKATLTPDELSTYQSNRNAYCNPKGSKPSSQTQQPQQTQQTGQQQDNWQSSRSEVKVESQSNPNVKPTNKNLTVKQAQSELDTAKSMLQDGIDNRNLTQADYKAGQELVKEAQANLDYAKTAELQAKQDLTTTLKQVANKQAEQQAQEILNSQSPQANVDKWVAQAKNVNTTDMYIEGANGQIEINPNYKAPAAPKTSNASTSGVSQAEQEMIRYFRNQGDDLYSTVIQENAVPKVAAPKTAAASTNTAASETEILAKSQALYDVQTRVNNSWSSKPSQHQNPEAWAQWKTQHTALESELESANQALQALFGN